MAISPPPCTLALPPPMDLTRPCLTPPSCKPTHQPSAPLFKNSLEQPTTHQPKSSHLPTQIVPLQFQALKNLHSSFMKGGRAPRTYKSTLPAILPSTTASSILTYFSSDSELVSWCPRCQLWTSLVRARVLSHRTKSFVPTGVPARRKRKPLLTKGFICIPVLWVLREELSLLSCCHSSLCGHLETAMRIKMMKIEILVLELESTS